MQKNARIKTIYDGGVAEFCSRPFSSRRRGLERYVRRLVRRPRRGPLPVQGQGASIRSEVLTFAPFKRRPRSTAPGTAGTGRHKIIFLGSLRERRKLKKVSLLAAALLVEDDDPVEVMLLVSSVSLAAFAEPCCHCRPPGRVTRSRQGSSGVARVLAAAWDSQARFVEHSNSTPLSSTLSSAPCDGCSGIEAEDDEDIGVGGWQQHGSPEATASPQTLLQHWPWWWL